MYKKAFLSFVSLGLLARLVLSPVNADISEHFWNDLFADILRKYAASEKLDNLCPSEEACMEEVKSWKFDDRMKLPLSKVFEGILQKFHSDLPTADASERVNQIMKWLRTKYGLLDDPIFTQLNPSSAGSYQSRGPIHFRSQTPKLPEIFEPLEASSIQDLDAYILRKWGGLNGLASPDHILFSELGTRDTLTSLQNSGFTSFYLINAPYSMRGSKALLAYPANGEAPTLVFHSFISRDLMQHKLMQLSHFYRDRFSQIRVISSNNLKSWEVADLRVTKALKNIPDIQIDDLVIGYNDILEKDLREKGAVELKTVRLSEPGAGDFATLKYFRTPGKNISRVVCILTDVDFRYFGKSALTLIRPFFYKGVDRVIFAGSAGSLNPHLPLHSLVIPRTFHELTDDGKISPQLPIQNDLFGLLPYGVSHAGPHISVSSPLVETRKRIRALRQQKFLTVDVEGSRIAAAIAEHNQKYGTKIRFASAFITTDTPISIGDQIIAKGGLHNPDFKGKRNAKALYASALNLLWEIPDRFRPSSHTRLISEFYAKQIQSLQQTDPVGLAILYSEMEARLREIESHMKSDLRVSYGLTKTYRDLLRILDRMGITPLDPEYNHEKRELVEMPKLSPLLQRALILQSLTRSSTLNSGEVGYGKHTAAQNRARALEGVEKAVDYLFLIKDRALKIEDIQYIHILANAGVLGREHLGKFKKFDFHPWDGPPVSSEAKLEEFLDWLAKATPSAETALEAYQRYEHLHLTEDGSGRTAELIAQHMMLRANAHPLLFPNRFDIEYILSLRRNGSFYGSNQRYLERLVENSVKFSLWLKLQIPETQMKSVHLDRDSDGLRFEAADHSLVLRAAFRSSQKFKLERESRVFVDLDFEPRSGFPKLSPPLPGQDPHVFIGSISEYQTQYEKLYGLMLAPACTRPLLMLAP